MIKILNVLLNLQDIKEWDNDYHKKSQFISPWIIIFLSHIEYKIVN